MTAPPRFSLIPTCVLVGAFLVRACGGLAVSADVGTADAGADATLPPLIDAPKDAPHDAPSVCTDASLDSSVACVERALVACPLLKGEPSLDLAIHAIATKCYQCTGTGTCGWMTLDIDQEGCMTPLSYSHAPQESFAACVRAAMVSSRFDCLQYLDAGPLEVALGSCTK
jgi:hypothetical protein